MTVPHLRPTRGGATTFSQPQPFGSLSCLLVTEEAQLLLPFHEGDTTWEYAVANGLKFKYALSERSFLVGHSRAATRPFRDVVQGFYDFAAQWFEPESLAFVPHELPWTLYGWSKNPTYSTSDLNSSLSLEELGGSAWVGSSGAGTTMGSGIGTGMEATLPSPLEALNVNSNALRRAPLLAELNKAAETASQDDWDAYGGVAVTQEALEGARRFIRLLGWEIPEPEITPGSRGEITFDWYRDQRMIFTVSIANGERIHYAGLFGKSKISGSEEFGLILPESVRRGIARVFGESGVARR